MWWGYCAAHHQNPNREVELEGGNWQGFGFKDFLPRMTKSAKFLAGEDSRNFPHFGSC